MELVGTIQANLRAALQSARRLAHEHVHPDTVAHWEMIVAAAKAQEAGAKSFTTHELVGDLEHLIEARGPRGVR